jgi:purine-binding chemotaxis protein CheW
MNRVRTIQRVDNLQREAGEDGQVGSLALGDVMAPVWSLAERLGETAVAATTSQRVIVLNDPQRVWGLLVDRVSQVLTVTTDAIYLLPDLALNLERPYFDRVIRQGDELLLLLSVDCLHPDAPPVVVPAVSQTIQPRPTMPLAATPSTKQGRVVVFKLPGTLAGDTPLAWVLSVSQVPEILEPLPLLAVPGAPDFVLGLANWRNQPVTVIDLARRMDLPVRSGGNGRSRLMIVRAAGLSDLVGFLVDPGIRVLKLPFAHHSCPVPTLLDSSTVLCSVELPTQEIISIPDLDVVLSSTY